YPYPSIHGRIWINLVKWVDLSPLHRTVNRAYVGVLSANAARERIIRAFLIEQQKIVKKALKIQHAKEKLASKS
ncbi:unnamed protein product, partial [Coffea canephora]